MFGAIFYIYKQISVKKSCTLSCFGARQNSRVAASADCFLLSDILHLYVRLGEEMRVRGKLRFQSRALTACGLIPHAASRRHHHHNTAADEKMNSYILSRFIESLTTCSLHSDAVG
jgi:hypothetical protein